MWRQLVVELLSSGAPALPKHARLLTPIAASHGLSVTTTGEGSRVRVADALDAEVERRAREMHEAIAEFWRFMRGRGAPRGAAKTTRASGGDERRPSDRTRSKKGRA